VVRDGRYKSILARSPAEQRWIGGEGEPFVLYDLELDPGETRSLHAELPEELERLKRALWQWENEEPFPVHLDAVACEEEPEVDTRTQELLRALGYLD
jgi:hypothetical protein